MAGLEASAGAGFLADLPTAAESGVPGFENAIWNGVVLPGRTPPPLIARFSRGKMATSYTLHAGGGRESYLLLPIIPPTRAA